MSPAAQNIGQTTSNITNITQSQSQRVSANRDNNGQGWNYVWQCGIKLIYIVYWQYALLKVDTLIYINFQAAFFTLLKLYWYNNVAATNQ